MDYQAALSYLLDQADLERDPSRRQVDAAFHIERMRAFLDRLGRPDEGRLTVHVAGSKGKGSTAAMVAAVLQAAGFRTGLYTSPHLHSFRERIAVDGEPIDEAGFAAAATDVRPAAEEEGTSGGYGRVTTFEHLTAMAFAWFERVGCDAQVIEVGLGGRLDATNAMAAKDVCVVTPISLEHTEILGPTVELIAGEKAGIFAAGAHVVLAPQRYAGAHAVLVERASALGCPVRDAGGTFQADRMEAGEGWQRARIEGPGGVYDVRLPLLGAHQVENATTAIAAIEALRERGAKIPTAAVEEGLAGVNWPGRMEIAGHAPLVILDGAHNGDSAARLRESLVNDFHHERMTLIIGVGRDKDVAAIAAELVPLAQRVICTRSSHPRAADPGDVAAAFAAAGRPAEVIPDLGEALRSAVGAAAEDDLVCVMGSLFVVADAREQLLTAPLPAGYSRQEER